MGFVKKNAHPKAPLLTNSESTELLSVPTTRNSCQSLNEGTVPTLSCCSSSAESHPSRHTVPYMCPLCFTRDIQCPVHLHPAHVESSGTRNICVACRSCVVRWREMVGESSMQCPQCSVSIYPGTALEHRDSIKLLEEGEVVVNCSAISSVGGSYSGIVSQQSALCGICEENTAQEYCMPCGFPLCALCQESSHKRGQYRAHKLVPLHSARTRSTRYCPEHSEQMLDLFCFTCRVCVCLTCCFGGKHKAHAVEPLADVAVRMRSQLKADMAAFEPVAAAASDLANTFEKQLPVYESHICNVQRCIQQYFDALRKDLKRREEKLQLEVLDESSRVKGTVFRFISQCRAAHASFQQISSIPDERLHIGDPADLMRCENVMRQSVHALSSAVRVAHNSGRVALRSMETILAQNGDTAVFFGDIELTEVISRTGRLEYLDVFGNHNKCSGETISDTKLSLLQSVPESELGLQESNDRIDLSIPPRTPSDEQLKLNNWTLRQKSTERLSLHIGSRATTPQSVLESDIPSSGAESRVMFYRLSTRKRFLRAGSKEHSSASPPLNKSRLSSAFTGFSGLFPLTRGTSGTLDEATEVVNANANAAVPTPLFTSSYVEAPKDVSIPRGKECGNASLHLQLRL